MQDETNKNNPQTPAQDFNGYDEVTTTQDALAALQDGEDARREIARLAAMTPAERLAQEASARLVGSPQPVLVTTTNATKTTRRNKGPRRTKAVSVSRSSSRANSRNTSKSLRRTTNTARKTVKAATKGSSRRVSTKSSNKAGR